MKRIDRNCLLSAFIVVACFTGASTVRAQGRQPAGEHLKFVLVLTRHGVRSPTWTNARLDEYSRRPWPKWSVAPGILTPHGKILMTQFGAYYREYFASLGLLSSSGCADADKVYTYADTDERTLETGHGIDDGLFPGCAPEVHSLGAGVQDVLFHSAGKIGSPDPSLALAAVAGRIGNEPSALFPAYKLQLDLMQQVLSACSTEPGNGPSDEPCKDALREKKLLDIPAILTPGKGDHLVEMKGPLNTAATFAENFQLEYLEGMPRVSWASAEEDQMRSLMALHAAASDILQRTPYIARTQASNLLMHMLRTLEQAETEKKVAGAIGTPVDKAVFLVGHDTNISNVAALLDAHWLVDGYQRDDAAPGGALVLELWQRPGQEDAVRAYYTVQTPDQMRKEKPVSLTQPPGKAVVFLTGCSESGFGAPCSWTAFQQTVSKAFDPGFTQID